MLLCRGRFYLEYCWDMRFRIRWGCKQGHGFEWEKKYIQIQNRQYCKTRNCQPIKQIHKIQSLEQSIYMQTIAAAWIYSLQWEMWKVPTLAYIFVIGPCFNFIINLTLARYLNLITDQLLSVENYKYHRSLENVYFILIRIKLKILLPAHCVNSKMLRYFELLRIRYVVRSPSMLGTNT